MLYCAVGDGWMLPTVLTYLPRYLHIYLDKTDRQTDEADRRDRQTKIKSKQIKAKAKTLPSFLPYLPSQYIPRYISFRVF